MKAVLMYKHLGAVDHTLKVLTRWVNEEAFVFSACAEGETPKDASDKEHLRKVCLTQIKPEHVKDLLKDGFSIGLWNGADALITVRWGNLHGQVVVNLQGERDWLQDQKFFSEEPKKVIFYNPEPFCKWAAWFDRFEDAVLDRNAPTDQVLGLFERARAPHSLIELAPALSKLRQCIGKSERWISASYTAQEQLLIKRFLKLVQG